MFHVRLLLIAAFLPFFPCYSVPEDECLIAHVMSYLDAVFTYDSEALEASFAEDARLVVVFDQVCGSPGQGVGFWKREGRAEIGAVYNEQVLSVMSDTEVIGCSFHVERFPVDGEEYPVVVMDLYAEQTRARGDCWPVRVRLHDHSVFRIEQRGRELKTVQLTMVARSMVLDI